VEDRRLGGPGGIVVCCAVRCARSFRAAAAVSRGHGAAFISEIGAARLVAIARRFPTRGLAFAAKPAGPPQSEHPAQKAF
jgi:hypothetical protein